MSQLHSSTLALALTTVLGAATVAYATNGLKLTAYGARAAGRGGVDYAFADDGSGPATNPAGMGFTWGNRFDNSWALINADVRWTNKFGTARNTEEWYFATPAYSLGLIFDPTKEWEVGNVFDLGRWGLVDDEAAGDGVADEAGAAPAAAEVAPADYTEEELFGGRFKFGLGVFPLAGGKITMEDLDTGGPDDTIPVFRNDDPNKTVDWQTDALAIAVVPSFAYRFTRNFSLGLALQVLHADVEVDGGIAQPVDWLAEPFGSTTKILAPNRAHSLTVTDMDDTRTDGENNNGYWGLSARLGLMYRVPLFSIGCVYQEESWGTDLYGRVSVDASDQVKIVSDIDPTFLATMGLDPAKGYVSNYDIVIQKFKFPRQFGLGFGLFPADWVSLGFDYTFIQWSHTHKRFRTRLSNGDNPNLAIMAGPTIRVRVPTNFRDQHAFAFGATFRLFEGEDLVPGVPSKALFWRFGYNYGKNPVPGNTTLPQQPAIAEHHLSTGFTFRWGPLLELTGAVEWALPTTLRTGAHIGDYTLSNSEQSLELWFFHFGLGVNF